MFDDTAINNLVWNLLNENNYSHCRLCLKETCENFIRFQDCVFINAGKNVYRELSHILRQLFGSEISNEIPGIDAVCLKCVDKVIDIVQFIEKYEIITKMLDTVLDNLNSTLTVNIDTSGKDQSLYVTVSSEDTSLVLVNNETDSLKSPVKTPTVMICSECNDNFEDIDDFQEHNLSSHNLFTCLKCLDTFKCKKDQEAHKASEENHRCASCTHWFCTEESLKKHEDRIHTSYVCKECGKSVRGLEKLLIHERSHVKSTCEKCGKIYATKPAFLNHVELCLKDRIEKHPIRSKIVKTCFCKLCGKGYSTPGGLRVHDRFVHGNAKPHVCEYCNKKFTAPSYLKVHMVTHTRVKNFTCDICNGKFVSKEALLYHTRRHTGERPYSCHLCDERFVNASARAEHIKFKHVGPTLVCEICSRKFVTHNFLRLHMNRHHDPTSRLYSGRCCSALIPGQLNHTVSRNGSSS